jgi:parallel beta-helix repeat protein
LENRQLLSTSGGTESPGGVPSGGLPRNAIISAAIEAPSADGTTDIELGTVDLRHLTLQSSALEPVRLLFTPVRSGTLTAELRSSANAQDVRMVLLATDEGGAIDKEVAAGQIRLDHQVIAGESYCLRVEGDDSGGELVLANLVCPRPDGADVFGTDGADYFEVAADNDRFAINGVEYLLAQSADRSISFDGGAGRNAALVRGDSGSDRVTMGPGKAIMLSDGLEVNVQNASKITADGNGGQDMVVFRDSPSDDRFTAAPTNAKMAGPGFLNRAVDFSHVSARANRGGHDVANLLGSPGNDALVARPDSVKMVGPGSVIRSIGFEVVRARAAAGGRDTATMQGSPGDDTFVGKAESSKLTGVGFTWIAAGFEKVRASGGIDGSDEARLFDTLARDHLLADANWVELSDPAIPFSNRAIGFDRVLVRSSNPGDSVNISPSSDSTIDLRGPGVAGEVNVDGFFREHSPTCGLQDAVNALPPEGGVVHIPKGIYRLRRSLVLRSGVELRGAGSDTVLMHEPESRTRLTAVARAGDRSVVVASTEGLREGDEVRLVNPGSAEPMAPYYIVEQVTPQRITFESPIAATPDTGTFGPDQGTILVRQSPLIRGGHRENGRRIRDVVIENLKLDGNAVDTLPYAFTFAGISLDGIADSTIRNCTVRACASDGIYLSDGDRIRVENCLILECIGHGIHLGGGFRDSVITGNVCRGNRADGLYFCWNVQNNLVENNRFDWNRRHGIGGLGWGGDLGDRFNVISGNYCLRNGRHGICAGGSRDNVISRNVCRENSQRTPGKYSGIYLGYTRDTTVTDNRCDGLGEESTQNYGIEEAGRSDHNTISRNLCEGNRHGGIGVVGASTLVSDNSGTVVRT